MADKYVQMHPLNETKTALDESVNVFPIIGPGSFKGFDPEAAVDPDVFKPQEKLVSGENIKALAFSEKQPAASLLGSGVLNLPLLDLLYPVGSIYMCAEDKFDGICPIQQLLGGTWVRIKDKFMYAAGDNDEIGATGGSKDAVVVSHAHEIAAESGGHTHNITVGNKTLSTKLSTRPGELGTIPIQFIDMIPEIENNGMVVTYTKLHEATGRPNNVINMDGTTATSHYDRVTIDASHNHTANIANNTGKHTHTVLNTGVDGTGKNMPPYLVVYMWKRVEEVESEE